MLRGDVGPWYLVDGDGGTRALNNKANLTTMPLVPIWIDENGRNLFSTAALREVWTGTLSGGQKAGSTCSNWTAAPSGTSWSTGQYGSWSSTDGWTSQGEGDCSVRRHLYCIEQ